MNNVYSVGQVNQYIKNMFAQDFMLHEISLKGEVSNCKYHSRGHIYFKLKDETGTIDAVMFAGNRKRGLLFPMKEGDMVIVTGSIEVYERDGKYQIYARNIEQDGRGNLYLEFEKLKQELEEMGMFAKEYKQPIPPFAKTVGIVTAPTGAAIQDIRNISARRNPFVQLILYPAQVQGLGAAESIVNGIHALDMMGVDVMIVGRGGGSIEDLWAFNEEIVARAIFECRTPVISAVGHQTDWTIADYVADLRAPTPSAAAELAVFDYRQTIAELAGLRQQMDKELSRKLAFARERLNRDKMQLHYLSPQNRLNENRHRAADYEEKLTDSMRSLIKDRRHTLSLLAGTLDSYSPVRKLSGGYAFVEGQDGKAVRSAKSVEKGDTVHIRMLDGTVHARVTETDSEWV
ncbi:MAG: exodeoxyribonuclease VII large subunit [Lachnospiraceae bacterium]|nr:exodeoxyribonuclease VII large subunit [Agathobacter sp.]MDD6445959.1 exodeoxyribonuclease VII large subunit [Lachnospiraceae bacterium]